jgi:hypothetical protein
MYWRAGLAMAMAAWVADAQAFEVLHAEARYQDKEFRVELDLILNAPAQRVEAVLRNYEGYPSLDASILESRVVNRIDAETVLLYTKLRACAGVFCRTVDRVERVQERPFELLAMVVPDESDVAAGRTQTAMQTMESRTRVRYSTSVAPKFWVPALIGRPLMLRTLREASLDLFGNVEKQAQE